MSQKMDKVFTTTGNDCITYIQYAANDLNIIPNQYMVKEEYVESEEEEEEECEEELMNTTCDGNNQGQEIELEVLESVVIKKAPKAGLTKQLVPISDSGKPKGR